MIRVLVVVLTFILTFIFVSKSQAEVSPRIASLDIVESYTIPAVEISGLAWRTNPKTKSRELLVVSDREHKIYLVDWENRKTKFDVKTIDLKTLDASLATEQSEWESVFSDETGRVFLIKEHPAQILVLSPEMDKIEKKISLKVGNKTDEEIAWHRDENAKGEGLMPLKNGHVIVVKEKDPLKVIEFAPEGNKASGYSPDLSIETKGQFILPKADAVDFDPVATWSFTKEIESLLEDSSGLNVDAKGTLYLLSDQRNLIALLGPKLSTMKKVITVSKLWSLPSRLKQPEGMVIDDLSRPIIALDRKNTDQPNLFLMSQMK